MPKLLLTHFALQHGFGVFIGRNGMNISRDPFPKGIYFDKCLSKHKLKFHEHQVLDHGNMLVSFDEEGLLFASPENYASHRFSQMSVDLSTLIFSWGQQQEDIFRRYADVQGKLQMTGSPRVDLWSAPLTDLNSIDVSNLVEQFGDFILVVSNWGFTTKEKIKGINPDQTYNDNPLSLIRSSFLSLIKNLSAMFPKNKIIVRPHPADRNDYWISKATQFADNIEVRASGSISPWVHAAKAVVHNNCTTGLEAWLGGKMPIVFSPDFENFPDYHRYSFRINQLGELCRNEDEVFEAIDRRLAGTSLEACENEKRMVEGFVFRKEGEFAAERMINSLESVDCPNVEYRIPQYGIRKKARSVVARLKWRVRDLLNLSDMYTLEYTLGKNKGMEGREIKDTLESIRTQFSVSADTFEVKQVDRDTFCIYSKEPVFEA